MLYHLYLTKAALLLLFFKSRSWKEKTCSTSLVIREIQIKTTARNHFTSTRMTRVKFFFLIKREKIHFGEDVEKLEPSYIASRNAKWFSHYGKQFGSSSKSLTQNYIWTCISTLRCIPNGLKTRTQTSTCACVYGSSIHNSQRGKTAQCALTDE